MKSVRRGERSQLGGRRKKAVRGTGAVSDAIFLILAVASKQNHDPEARNLDFSCSIQTKS